MANQTVTLWGDQTIGYWYSWTNWFFESGASGNMFTSYNTASAQASTPVPPGPSSSVSPPSTQFSQWVVDMGNGTLSGYNAAPSKYIFVSGDTTGQQSALFSVCGFCDNPTLATGLSVTPTYNYNPYYNYFTAGNVQSNGFIVPTYRQVKGVQVTSTFGIEGVSSGAAAPSVTLDIGSVGVLWGHNTLGADSVPSTLIGDVSFGTTSGQSTGGFTGQLWTQLGQWVTGTTSYAGESNVRPFQLSDIQNLAINVFVNSRGVAAAEVRFQTIGLIVSYNDPPMAQQINVQGLTNGGTASTTAPTIGWTYSDPENNAQAGYRVLVFNQSDATGPSFPSTVDVNNVYTLTSGSWVNSAGAVLNSPPVGKQIQGNIVLYSVDVNNKAHYFFPVWDSGVQASSANSVQVSAGALSNYKTYRAFVFLTDDGSGGRYNTCTNYGNESLTLYTALTATNQSSVVVANPGSSSITIPYGANLILQNVSGQQQYVAVNSATTIAAGARTPAVSIAPVTFPYAMPATTTTISVVNTGIDFTVATEPVLMPALEMASSTTNPSNAFSASAAGIGYLEVQARTNLLSTIDADFTGAAAPSAGTWAVDASFFTIAHNPTIATATLTVSGISWDCLKITPASSFNTAIAVAPGYVAVDAGTFITAEFKYWCALAGVQIGIEFYSDAAGTVKIGTSTTTPLGPSMPANVITNLPVKTFVQCRVPDAALTARIVCYQGTTATADPIYLTQAAITPGVANLLDDASFESTTSTANQFWTIAAAQETSVPVTPATYPYSAECVNLNSTNTTAQTSYLFALDADTGANYAIGYEGISAGTSGTITPSGGSWTGTALTAGSSTAWTRSIQTFSGATFNTTPGRLTFTYGTASTYIDNTQLEMLWPYAGSMGTFGSVASGSTLPAAQPLGQVTGLTTAGIQGSFWAAPSTSASAVTITTVTTKALVVNAAAGGNTNYAELNFSVAGYTSFTFSGTVAAYNGVATILAQFFDSAGIELSQGATPLSINSPVTVFTSTVDLSSAPTSSASGTAFGPITLTPPANAAFCRLTFSFTSDATGTSPAGYLWNPAITPSGSLAPSTPWLDGGWSAGGTIQSETSYSLPLQLNVYRSPTAYSTPNPLSTLPSGASSVRFPPSSATAGVDVLVSGALQGKTIDYEYPAADLYTSQSVSYVASVTLPDGQSVPPSQPVTVTAASSFSPTNWMLIDPLVPANNVALQVKKVTFAQDENQTVLMPAGRGRKVVIGDTQIFGDTITMDLLTLTTADYDALHVQLNKVYPLLLRSPDGEMWYVRLTKRSRERVWQGSYTRPYRTYSITMEQVDAVA